MPAPEDTILKAVRDTDRGRRNLASLASHLGERAAALFPPLGRLLPRAPDPDMALNNLERLFARSEAQSHLPALLENRARELDATLLLLATSQFFADALAAYPEFLSTVFHVPRRNPTTAELTAQLRAEIEAAGDDPGVLRAFRRFRDRHTLRIGIGDVIRDRPLEEITRELSRLADASIEVAMQHAARTVGARFGTPLTPAGRPAKLTALAFGKLGGDELNYSSDIDLMFVYDLDGETNRRSGVTNAEFFDRVIKDVVRLLSSHTDRGQAYRIDLRLRPEGNRGPLARSIASTLSYYDTMGRTWERQALIKLRHVGGDAGLARDFLSAIEPFVYRKYFSFAEINEVKALKRQMEQKAQRAQLQDADFPRDVKTGRGGIRDIEYTVQFLQLLNGGDLPAVRQRNTLLGLEALEIAGCLNPQETYILADAYRFLRKTEHRLQLLFDLQTHKLPAGGDELRKLARRMGYAEPARAPGAGARGESKKPEEPPAPESELRAPGSTLAAQRRSPLDEAELPPLDTRDLLVDPLDQFLKDLQDKTALDRAILNHLLHQSFPGENGHTEPEADLILHPDPDPDTVRAVLGRYPFRDVPKAFANLSGLARESVPFLSARRCRHFLASIAPALLRAVASRPDPDEALTNLERVSASLGAKAVLWELFSISPPSLKLYVELCAGSPFLSGLLINNPGMVDELLDSLVLNQPRTADDLRAELTELLRGATDPDPILHSFQDKEFLRIGVADLLHKTDIRANTAALSDIAETLLNQVVELVEPAVTAKLGAPGKPSGTGADEACPYVLLGLGKLGGREISYHSDLDLLLIYETDGTTSRGESNRLHFTELAQRVIKLMSHIGPRGRLYEVDMRLRPTGKSGSLVLPLAEFRRYFAGSACQLWERQALGRARVVRGAAAFAAEVTAVVRDAMLGPAWRPDVVEDVRAMRQKLESTAGPRSLKRGPGGLTDVEFVVQLLQLKHGRERPEVLAPNVWDALDALAAAGLLPEPDATALRDGYTFLRLVEARLRIVTDRPLTELPEAEGERAKLAHRLGFDAPADFLAAFTRITAGVRAAYSAVLARARA
ncbi:Glutamate-ammonia-ligase adenylyltransferase [Gemmata obscuriglobus]|uniref:Bifunctional [glutamate--ammonia ligase]-adenylyl-L-tyrosine phosphorylase/[glutamate--ammonia-ligase] adenylyltransferase n=1 Tax=Gemmata obscuriglobus TaxID=114 RepID=A0A2Z3HC80_9BACT|nr:bifunctional [glutamate--ammonia ligase]-adenylyl-L-tyrosine phosphorylase/[glutamate--ammonia-ligase] adenylyltransferase [Gemmata obscuriglobus]AWM42012.1 bifunctional [glutamate--ammonia ligase]-adenylyl-L-tyrosine phosphorylase/[glutamate--ammonia-ligase] adenylyltransferase [Gemmata obscuriglobus]QEG31997.1 Glutamate-ammonia-ligase adenylyltransferase [Gemmata obscuriglobus]VTS11347.1 (glutamate--ammonia-ligase) adenylyltransferase : Glutamate-ammonia-ligase adenylyltransferase OS=Blasto